MNKTSYKSNRLYFYANTPDKLNKGNSIRYYNKFIGFFLSIIGMATNIKINSKNYYLNNKSFAKFMIRKDELNNLKNFYSPAYKLDKIYKKMLNDRYDKAKVNLKIADLKTRSNQSIHDLIHLSKRFELENCSETIEQLILDKDLNSVFLPDTSILHIDEMEKNVERAGFTPIITEIASTKNFRELLTNSIFEKGSCILINNDGSFFYIHHIMEERVYPAGILISELISSNPKLIFQIEDKNILPVSAK